MKVFKSALIIASWLGLARSASAGLRQTAVDHETTQRDGSTTIHRLGISHVGRTPPPSPIERARSLRQQLLERAVHRDSPDQGDTKEEQLARDVHDRHHDPATPNNEEASPLNSGSSRHRNLVTSQRPKVVIDAARGGAANMSSVDGNATADKAVDGDAATLAVTMVEDNPTWTVALKSNLAGSVGKVSVRSEDYDWCVLHDPLECTLKRYGQVVTLQPSGASIAHKTKPIRINCAGRSYSGDDGYKWQDEHAENSFFQGGTPVYDGQIATPLPTAFQGAVPEGLFHSYRQGAFSYSIPLESNGKHYVRLFFRADENPGTAAPPFNVTLEGNLALVNHDLNDGNSTAYQSYVRVFWVDVQDKALDIKFTEEAKLFGIEVLLYQQVFEYDFTGRDSAGSTSLEVSIPKASTRLRLADVVAEIKESRFRLNCGTPDDVVQHDMAFLGGHDTFGQQFWHGGTGKEGIFPESVSGVEPFPEAIYITNHRDSSMYTYVIPFDQMSGSVMIRLHFAERYFESTGKRIGNVYLNGDNTDFLLVNADTVSLAGGKNKAYHWAAAVEIVDGKVELAFTTKEDKYGISAIEILPDSMDNVLMGEVVHRPLKRYNMGQYKRDGWVDADARDDQSGYPTYWEGVDGTAHEAMYASNKPADHGPLRSPLLQSFTQGAHFKYYLNDHDPGLYFVRITFQEKSGEGDQYELLVNGESIRNQTSEYDGSREFSTRYLERYVSVPAGETMEIEVKAKGSTEKARISTIAVFAVSIGPSPAPTSAPSPKPSAFPTSPAPTFEPSPLPTSSPSFPAPTVAPSTMSPTVQSINLPFRLACGLDEDELVDPTDSTVVFIGDDSTEGSAYWSSNSDSHPPPRTYPRSGSNISNTEPFMEEIYRRARFGYDYTYTFDLHPATTAVIVRLHFAPLFSVRDFSVMINGYVVMLRKKMSPNSHRAVRWTGRIRAENDNQVQVRVKAVKDDYDGMISAIEILPDGSALPWEAVTEPVAKYTMGTLSNSDRSAVFSSWTDADALDSDGEPLFFEGLAGTAHQPGFNTQDIGARDCDPYSPLLYQSFTVGPGYKYVLNEVGAGRYQVRVHVSIANARAATGPAAANTIALVLPQLRETDWDLTSGRYEVSVTGADQSQERMSHHFDSADYGPRILWFDVHIQGENEVLEVLFNTSGVHTGDELPASLAGVEIFKRYDPPSTSPTSAPTAHHVLAIAASCSITSESDTDGSDTISPGDNLKVAIEVTNNGNIAIKPMSIQLKHTFFKCQELGKCSLLDGSVHYNNETLENVTALPNPEATNTQALAVGETGTLSFQINVAGEPKQGNSDATYTLSVVTTVVADQWVLTEMVTATAAPQCHKIVHVAATT